MKVHRMRIRFEDPRIAPDQAQAIARRVSELVTGERAADRLEPADGLARHVADRVSDTLRTAGE
jgi:hypothetical protein